MGGLASEAQTVAFGCGIHADHPSVVQVQKISQEWVRVKAVPVGVVPVVGQSMLEPIVIDVAECPQYLLSAGTDRPLIRWSLTSVINVLDEPFRAAGGEAGRDADQAGRCRDLPVPG